MPPHTTGTKEFSVRYACILPQHPELGQSSGNRPKGGGTLYWSVEQVKRWLLL
jgi:hypothetical protein